MDGKWPWAKTHSWQSWQTRYRDNEAKFDYEIKKYQKKHGISGRRNDGLDKRQDILRERNIDEGTSDTESGSIEMRPSRVNRISHDEGKSFIDISNNDSHRDGHIDIEGRLADDMGKRKSPEDRAADDARNKRRRVEDRQDHMNAVTSDSNAALIVGTSCGNTAASVQEVQEPHANKSTSKKEVVIPAATESSQAILRRVLKAKIANDENYFASPVRRPSHTTSLKASSSVMQNEEAPRANAPMTTNQRSPRLYRRTMRTGFTNSLQAASYNSQPPDSDSDTESNENDNIIKLNSQWPPSRKGSSQVVPNSAANEGLLHSRNGESKSLVNSSESYIVDGDKLRSGSLKPTEREFSSIPLENSAKKEKIHANIRSNISSAHYQRRQSARLSSTTAGSAVSVDSRSSSSDPFLTSEHAERLRLDKGKGKSAKDPDRRKTFNGFPNGPDDSIPVHILQKQSKGRASPTTDPVFNSRGSSKSVPWFPASKTRLKRRKSLASLIDLTTDHPSSRIRISATDEALVKRAGLQYFLKVMAEHHQFSEEKVCEVYEQLQDLQETDFALEKMAAASNQVLSAQLSRESSESLSRDSEEQVQSNRTHVTASGVDNDRYTLHVTPLSDREALWNRERYSPPSASRAAAFARSLSKGRTNEARLRERRRLSGGGDRPLKLKDNDTSRPQGGDTSKYSPQAGYVRVQPSRSSVAQMHSSPVGMKNSSTKVNQQAWTVEEDEVIRQGEDEHALEKIEKRRGPGSVKHRIAELIAADLF